jgi:hypothetical protein
MAHGRWSPPKFFGTAFIGGSAVTGSDAASILRHIPSWLDE